MYKILDRNLGATGNGTGTDAYGYYFQRGNNYGFTENTLNGSQTRINAGNYGPGTANGYYVGNHFYTKKNNTWDSSNNANLWGNTTDTNEARQGPCPSGYHVPTNEEFQIIYDIFTNMSGKGEYCGSQEDAACFINIFNIPLGGQVVPQNQKNQGKGSATYLYTSVPDGNAAYEMRFKNNTVSIDTNEIINYGDNIRCFSNDFGQYSDDIQIFTVEFETDGGTEVGSQTITGNEHVLEPEEPSKTGYEFMGWYKTGMEELWKFDTDVVTGDMTLYARWEEIPVYTVEFETDGGTEIDSQIVTGNEYVLQPENPIKTGYEFVGWYKTGMEELWKFDTDVVTGDMTLYAKWEEIPEYTVAFETDGGTIIIGVQVLSGNLLTQPEDPSKTGYEFMGWYKTGMEPEWNFETDIVTEDITLYAKWKDVTPPTFDFPNNSGYECATGIVRVNNLNDNEELSDSPISFDGINWDIVNTFDVFPKKGNDITIITGYVKDLAGNISTNTSIFTFVDTGVTATGFTISGVGTGISVNWKENTNAQEGDCGDFYLSAEIKTQGRIGVCSIVGDYVVYIPNDGEKGNDLCEIRIQDMENNNVNVTVNFTDIFSIEGILDAKIFATDINLIGRISTHIQNLDYISDTGALTIIDQKGLDVGRYTMISISNLTGILRIGNYIYKSNVYIKSNSVYTISGDINNDVKINTGLSEFVNIGSPILYMYRNLGQNNRKIGEYGSDFTIRINIPAYQLPDVYVGTIIFTIYENE